MARLSGQKYKYTVPGGDTKFADAEHRRTACSVTDLDGWFAGDVRDQEVHSDVLAVYVLVHHVPDGLWHHVRVQVGVVLQKHKHAGEHVNVMAMGQQKNTYG